MSTLNNPRSSFDWCAREDYPKRPAQLKGPHRVQNSTKQPPTAPDTQKTALAAHLAASPTLDPQQQCAKSVNNNPADNPGRC